MANHIELPDFMSPKIVERTYGRMIAMRKDAGRTPRVKRYLEKGMRMAVAQEGRLLLFLDKGAEYLRARNDEQLSRIEQLGYAKAQEFSEFATWRTAFERAAEPHRFPDVNLRVFGWVYAAVAEALDG